MELGYDLYYKPFNNYIYYIIGLYNNCIISSCRYENNPRLHNRTKSKNHVKLLVGTSVGVLVLVLVLFMGSLLLLRNFRRRASQEKDVVKGITCLQAYNLFN